MSNLIDDYRTLTTNVVKNPHLSRWLELLATTEKVLNKYCFSPGVWEWRELPGLNSVSAAAVEFLCHEAAEKAS